MEIVELILENLPRATHVRVVEGLIRMLAATKVKYDGSLLAKYFDESNENSLKWAIGNTLACSNAQNIGDWLARTILDERHGKAREMLCPAVAKHLPKAQARELLMAVFDQLSGHAAWALGSCGDQQTVAFLKSKQNNEYMTWIERKIEKSINRIEKRLSKSQKI